MPIAFVVGARWFGISGVAAGWLVLSPLTIVPLVLVLLRTIHLAYSQYFAALLPTLTGSAAMCVALLALRQWGFPALWTPTTMLAVQVVVGAAVYAAILMVFFRGKLVRYVNFLSSLRKTSEISGQVVS